MRSMARYDRSFTIPLLYKRFAKRLNVVGIGQEAGIGNGRRALLDAAGDDEKAEEDEQRAEDADDRIGALTGDVSCAHDGALGPHLKAHHDVRPDHIEPAKYEQNKNRSLISLKRRLIRRTWLQLI